MNVEHRANDETRYNDPIADSFHEWPSGSESGTIDISECELMPYHFTYCPTDA
jgi:hypothetical protein